MTVDHSQGWETVAQQFIVARSNIGGELVRTWGRENIPPHGSIIDIGCGSGVPIAQALINEGFQVFGIDASPTLVAAFRDQFSTAQVACETAQDSDFFNRVFDAAISVGLLFLLTGEDQGRVIRRVAAALKPGGHFLFSSPLQPCEWRDVLTGGPSKSLGSHAYERILDEAGLHLVGCLTDEGHNNYYDAVKL